MKNWKILDKMAQLDEIVLLSKQKPQLIYKHSTTCPVNADAKARIEQGFESLASKMDLYYLDLLTFRAISNEIETKFGVRHESPQVLLLKDGKVVFHGSHYKFDVSDILKHV